MTAADFAVGAVLALWDRNLPDASAAKGLCVDLGRAGTFITLSQADHVLWLRGVLADHETARWVPVTERLPDDGVYVLASVSEPDDVTGTCITRHLSGDWACSRNGYVVVAWQPLPKPWVKP